MIIITGKIIFLFLLIQIKRIYDIHLAKEKDKKTTNF
jgi:hypothetical protein